ncbi:hypothetical protein CWI38_1434p0030 [Hamiltosporidium tvaerminnensis]|uniref:Uncharacterized protein n=1 Tax=Hamiltosporidium tvaerminnensis TaxID=1176355 RepID=A0A4Q9LRG3_9MICR|nr:hypothetical protein CWI38_1434p0030 [Hamiltosporidium tvaerminnensis]
MNQNRCLILYGITADSLTSALQMIEDVSKGKVIFKETCSIFENGVLMTYLCDNIDMAGICKILCSKGIKIMEYEKYDRFKDFSKNKYEDLIAISENELFKWQRDLKNEMFVIRNNEKIVLYENCRGENIKIIFECEAWQVKFSEDGKFMVVNKGNSILLLGGESYGIFCEIPVKGVLLGFGCQGRFCVIRDAEFVYFYDVTVMKELYRFEHEGSEVIWTEDMRYLKFLNFQETFSIKDCNIMQIDNICGINCEIIEKVSFKNDMTAIITNEKIKNVIFCVQDNIVSKKNYVNFENSNIFWSENGVFVEIVRKLDNKTVVSLEIFKKDGTVLIVPLDCSISDLIAGDNSFFIFDTEKKLKFYQKKISTFTLLSSVSLSNKVILSKSSAADIFAIYDYASDSVEFYEDGKVISTAAHTSCTQIKWSHSGIYCSTISSGAQLGGLVQVFDIDGKLIWKKVFNRLQDFHWRPFIQFTDKEYLECNFEKLTSEIKNLNDEIQEESENIPKKQLISEWVGFLQRKKALFLNLSN